MKKIFMLLFFALSAICANAQWGYHHSHHYVREHCVAPRVVYSSYNSCYNNYYRRPAISVVIAPRPRVIVESNTQPQVVREWVAPHWEESNYGRIWVEGHYVQREVY